ncbi:MAG: hypothetical protein IPG92_14000 [Flavobacteriales bacterium]|nr:hypothetical protein [Flavobacteriales bacterium]
MKHLLSIALLLCGISTLAQNTIYSHAIGNWRNGSVVYITPLVRDHRKRTRDKAAIDRAIQERIPTAEGCHRHRRAVRHHGGRGEAGGAEVEVW